LIGIDTPESHKPGTPVECGAKRATANMERLAYGSGGTGRAVRLVTDPTQNTLDRYGRLLAYVYLTYNGHRMQTEQAQGRLGQGLRVRQHAVCARRLLQAQPGTGTQGAPRRVGTLRRQLSRSRLEVVRIATATPSASAIT
jgi:Staphylococcal nuclease homologue